MDNQNHVPGSEHSSSSQPTQATPVMHFDPKDVADNKLIAAIGYIGILCLIPLLLKKDSKFAQEHGKQALVVFIGHVILWIIGIFPILGWIIAFFGGLALLVLNIWALIRALGGEFWEVPFIGKFRNQINL